MTYTKPQLTNIGKASELIARPIDKDTIASDHNKVGTPAYDLDE
jgi:hypothetical protein